MTLSPRYIDPTDATIPPSSPPGEIINIIVSSFKPLYQLLIVTCVCSAMLIPLFVLLLFSSNAETRRKPIFIANMISIVIGQILAGVCIALIQSELLNPLQVTNIPLTLMYNILIGFSPLFVESILLIRLWAIYPFRTTPLRRFLAIFMPITLIKLARLASVVTYVVYLYNELKDDNQTLFWFRDMRRTRLRNYTVEWFLQVADNASVSVLFLMKLNEVRTFKSGVRGWSSVLQAFFWITISNFVIPAILSVIQLAVIWTSRDFMVVALICTVNIYVEIIGVLLATILAVGSRRREENSSRSVPVLTTVTVEMDESTTGYASIDNDMKPQTTEK
ncbi:hypothetical protein F5887DRAFT_577057 [Amanita rubescens]|nr:hypothetical protein F5887DRAFT_577057 [Amanita rubescens]